MNIHQKQIAALKLAIENLYEKRRKYAAGHIAYTQQKIRTVEINGDGITGTTMGFAQQEHEDWTRYDEAITQLEDLIEILQDPGVVRTQPTLFNMEQI